MKLKEREKLIAALRNAALPDPNDEREVMHAPLLREAVDEIVFMQGMLNKLIPVMDAAVELVCAPGWAGVSDEDCNLERVLRSTGFVAPNAIIQGPRSGPAGMEG